MTRGEWIAVIAVAVFVVTIVTLATRGAIAAKGRDRQFRTWAAVHCRVISASTSWGNVLVAYRCDDGRDYLHYGGDAPTGWVAK